MNEELAAQPAKLRHSLWRRIGLLLLGLLLGGLIWYAVGTQPTAVPLITLRCDDDNGGLGAWKDSSCVQVDQGGNIYIITQRVEHQVHNQLQMLVLAPDGKVKAAVPLRRRDGRPLTGLYADFVVNPQGTLWWTIRYAVEDWRGKGTDEQVIPVILSAHGADGRAQQEWELPIDELPHQLVWFYAAGDRQVYAYYADSGGKFYARAYTMGLQQSRRLNLSFFDTVMPDGSVWQYDTNHGDNQVASTPRYTYTFSHTPPGGTPSIWASFPEPFSIQQMTIIPSATGLFVLAASSDNTYPVYRIPRDGQLECIFDLEHLLKRFGRKGERIKIGRPVHVNSHGDLWVGSSSLTQIAPLEQVTNHRGTVWKITKLPRWQIWRQAITEWNTLR